MALNNKTLQILVDSRIQSIPLFVISASVTCDYNIIFQHMVIDFDELGCDVLTGVSAFPTFVLLADHPRLSRALSLIK